MVLRTAIPQTISPVTRGLFGDGVTLGLNPLQLAALELHRAGWSLFPLPFGSKVGWSGYNWRRFLTIRLAEDDIPLAFSGPPCNIAVAVGRISGGLLCLDCETVRRFQEVMETIARAKLNLWAESTRRGGHVWLQCADGEIANAHLTSDLEVRGSGCYVVTAPSKFADENGELHSYEIEARYGDQPPRVTFADLQALFPGISFRLAYRKASPLSINAQAFLAGLTPEGWRNPQLYTTTRELLARGLALPDVEVQVVGAAIATGLSRREALKTFWSAVEGHEKKGGKVNRDTTPRLWQRAQAWAMSQAWPGRAGMSRRGVFLAHIERCRRDAPGATQRATWRATERELSELARVARKTARNATRRLITDGFLAVVQRDLVDGNRYAFGQNVRVGEMTPLEESARYSGVVSPTFDGSSFERGGLPKSAALALSVLSEAHSPLRLCDICRVGKLSRDRARYALQRLEALGIVVKSGSRYELRVNATELPDTLAELAYQTGTAGAGEARRQGHIRDRQKQALEIVLKARGMPRPAPRKDGRDDAGSV